MMQLMFKAGHDRQKRFHVLVNVSILVYFASMASFIVMEIKLQKIHNKMVCVLPSVCLHL